MRSYDRIIRNMPFAFENETVLVKSRGAWHQADVVETLRKHHELLPVVKMIMLVRDPIHRYVSDLVHFNNKEKKKGRETFSDFDAIISVKVNPGRYFDYNERSVHQICMDLSDYATMYEQLHSFYPKDQVLWLDGDEFTENPVKILNQIESFIGIPKYFNENHFDFSGLKGYPCFKLDETSHSACMGKNKARDHPDLSEKSLKTKTTFQTNLG